MNIVDLAVSHARAENAKCISQIEIEIGAMSVVTTIAAITQHIPEKSFQLVRYSGWYSNRGRGEREKREQVAAAVSLPEVPAEVAILDIRL